MATTENAPSTRRSASLIRSASVFWIERAIRWMMHSLSEEDWKIEPRCCSRSCTAWALVMLPLWATANPPPDSTAFFSAAGPNALGVMKPDLVAPGANEDLLPLGYYEKADLPFTAKLARHFTVFDDYHCSLLGGFGTALPYFTGAQARAAFVTYNGGVVRTITNGFTVN